MRKMVWLAVLLIMSALLVFNGCSTTKKWLGLGSEDDEEAAENVPPESKQETVMIDGKPYVRSKNPYWLSYPNAPEYIYVEKGREFVPHAAVSHRLPGQGRGEGKGQGRGQGGAAG